mgnify:FL=1
MNKTLTQNLNYDMKKATICPIAFSWKLFLLSGIGIGVSSLSHQMLRLLIFLAPIFFLIGCSDDPKKTKEESIKRSVPVLGTLPEFQLIEQSGNAFGLKDLRGKVWIGDFIFTRCGGTCPMQTIQKSQIQDSLKEGPEWEDIRLITFTVDPENDTAPVLQKYADTHSADSNQWKFLTGSREDLWSLSANGFKLAVAEDSKNEKMPILHSSRFVLVDKIGRIRGYYDGLDEKGRADLMRDLNLVISEDQTLSAAGKESINYKKFPYPEEILNPSWLDSRKELQIASADNVSAYHDFQFQDTVEESGITFINQIVDDAGKYHKAVHYDHGNGIAVADVDGDGLLDLYFTTQIGSNELWKNLGGGKFKDITTNSIALNDKIGVSASFADTDNDGDADLIATTVRGGNYFFENDGKGNFTDRTDHAGLDYIGHSSGAVFFDYDKDGLLDLFLCNVGVYTSDERGKGGYCIGLQDAFQGHLKPEERNELSKLYRNEGDNVFVDVSKDTGLLDQSWTGDAAPLDFDNDGWVDLYVLSMQGHDQLYRNEQGKSFKKVSRDVFPKTPWGAMGIQIFDFDNDGNQDIYVTDMHSDMSEEVGPNREKLKSAMKWEESILKSGGKSIYGNAFFRSLGDGNFEEVSDSIGAENYWPWGLSAGDLNADGFIDVFIASSMNFPFRYGINSVLLNESGKRFADAEFILGVEPRRQGRTAKPWFTLNPSAEDKEHSLVKEYNLTEPVEVWGSLGTRSSAIIDIDNDGDLDIVMNEFHDGPMVLRSNLSEKKQVNKLKVQLIGKGNGASNRDGLGATVRVTAGSKTYVQVNDGVSGYLSHSLIPMYFGLGEANRVDNVTVRWPSGQEQTLKDIDPEELLKIIED